jgi:methylglyoxal synthase
MRTRTATMPARKRIALIAHDNMKPVLSAWVERHLAVLTEHQLVATGTTGHLLRSKHGLEIQSMVSGPLGGDQQIGAMLVDQQLDMIVFFWDPFEPQPHDPDVKALLRVAAVWNVAVACNQSSADFMIQSAHINNQYQYPIPDYPGYLEERIGKL